MVVWRSRSLMVPPRETGMSKPVQHLTVAERVAKGKAARAALPRPRHGEWTPSQRSLQPLDLLAEQARSRVPELVPIRHGRMAASPFAYYRGAALPMAADLATMAHSGLTVQLCGDAHLSNFGGFASPEREMLFDVNDFDETLPGPFEWDLKRLAASLEVAARSRGFDPATARAIVIGAVQSYREAIRAFADMPNLQVWYARLDVAEMIQRWGGQVGRKVLRDAERNVAKAQAKDQIKARAKLTTRVNGSVRFLSDPPLLVPVHDLFGDGEAQRLQESIHDAVRNYRRTLAGDRRHLLESYQYLDLARKVVGVGSVGTRAWVALFAGRDADDTLILQVKRPSRRCWSASSPRAHSTTADSAWSRASGSRRRPATCSWGGTASPRATTGDRTTTTYASCGTGSSRPTSTRCRSRAWAPTRACVPGRWPEATPDPVTPSRSAHISDAATSSTKPLPTSPARTPTKTKPTTKHCNTPSPPDTSKPKRASKTGRPTRPTGQHARHQPVARAAHPATTTTSRSQCAPDAGLPG